MNKFFYLVITISILTFIGCNSDSSQNTEPKVSKYKTCLTVVEQAIAKTPKDFNFVWLKFVIMINAKDPNWKKYREVTEIKYKQLKDTLDDERQQHIEKEIEITKGIGLEDSHSDEEKFSYALNVIDHAIAKNPNDFNYIWLKYIVLRNANDSRTNNYYQIVKIKYSQLKENLEKDRVKHIEEQMAMIDKKE